MNEILADKLNSATSPEKFGEFLKELRKFCSDNPAFMENVTTIQFLEALGAWIDDMGGDLAEAPSWRIFADAVMAGVAYE